ncbi:hypothetical protein B0H99_106252 [Planomicrobium soli]|uniref:Uncharacterized protein n=1 Tax=Planomicrobium soli TaxID=1176648 RepID=A0A2P8H1Z6_9BACL|nr:hypothetical protein [Planomicrobium soli]PSL40232.1 hypothetical protein B0H99_106252 [Planomicrobium soli]
MKEMHRISPQEEAGLPLFKSHEGARNYFEEKYGEKFVFEESIDSDKGVCFYYRLIINEEAYVKGITELNSTGYVGIEFMNSYQPVQIMEDGSLHIVYQEKRER